MKKHDSWWKILLVGAFALAILLIIPLIRSSLYDLSLIPGSEYYYAKRMAGLVDAKFVVDDPLIFGLRPHLVTPFDVVLRFWPFPALYLSLTIGVLSAMLAWIVLSDALVVERDRWIMIILLVASSSFMMLYCTVAPAGFVVFLVLLYLVGASRSSWWKIPFWIVPLLLPFFGVFAMIFALSVSFSHRSYLKLDLKQMYPWVIPIIILVVVQIATAGSASEPPAFLEPDRLVNLTSDFGGLYGLGIFSWILVCIGILLSWRDRRQLFPLYILLVLVLFYPRNPDLLRYWAVVAALFAAYAFIHFLDAKWEIALLRHVTLMVLVCGLLFSLVSFVHEHYDDPPNDEIMQSMNWLSRYTKPNAVVLAPYSRGQWITAAGNRTVLMDDVFRHSPELNVRENVTNVIYHETNLANVRRLMTSYSVNYVYIDASMRDGEVWVREDEGLLFLLRDSETFKKVYSNGYVEFWYVIPPRTTPR